MQYYNISQVFMSNILLGLCVFIHIRSQLQKTYMDGCGWYESGNTRAICPCGKITLMKAAPAFSLPDQDGVIHKLSDYAGEWLVVYFYPKDDTPACTTEACNFRDARDAIAEFGNAKVIGISKDTVRAHKKFTAKHNLNFTLLSDESHATIEAFGAWQLKKFMGREYMGIMRNTYIINPEGNIAKTFEDVEPKTHAAEIIAALKELQA